MNQDTQRNESLANPFGARRAAPEADANDNSIDWSHPFAVGTNDFKVKTTPEGDTSVHLSCTGLFVTVLVIGFLMLLLLAMAC